MDKNLALPVSAKDVLDAMKDIEDILDERLLDRLGAAIKQPEEWDRASALPRDYLARRGVKIPDRMEIDLGRHKTWPGRCCVRICRSVDPVPPPPEGPSGIYFCVELCLPCRPNEPPPIPPRPA